MGKLCHQREITRVFGFIVVQLEIVKICHPSLFMPLVLVHYIPFMRSPLKS